VPTDMVCDNLPGLCSPMQQHRIHFYSVDDHTDDLIHLMIW